MLQQIFNELEEAGDTIFVEEQRDLFMKDLHIVVASFSANKIYDNLGIFENLECLS